MPSSQGAMLLSRLQPMTVVATKICTTRMLSVQRHLGSNLIHLCSCEIVQLHLSPPGEQQCSDWCPTSMYTCMLVRSTQYVLLCTTRCLTKPTCCNSRLSSSQRRALATVSGLLRTTTPAKLPPRPPLVASNKGCGAAAAPAPAPTAAAAAL